MRLDLRYAIGLLLGTYGAILVVDGAVEHAIVLGVNVDLWWGAAMLASGLALLAFAHARRRR
ncbi:MAG TPA: hypothetical protein VGJ29_15900 [Vicinamibacterales bacterium]|jgi:hypothetical protein